jgi:hypothetical protein
MPRTFFGRSGWWGRGHHDVYVHANKFGGERGQPLVLSLRPSRLKRNVLAFYIAQLAQPLPEGLEIGSANGGWLAQEETDSGDLRRCLRVGSDRRGEEASRAHREEGASLHQ